ncbi:response regulator transcription factor [Thermogemmatispora carboxidivorans]|uniref:response regulator transcription factor n=1 Tax=Thermogemmatispora carboxidivorans TaxID=1382306 RepID=UPI000AD410D1|nr:helix-turn-helix domain-containing protein [Thermogemmatispora carboxidivorans]
MNQQQIKKENVILVADDERALRQGLQMLISRRYPDLLVLEASNGLECWHTLEREPQIRLAFIDIRMPEMDGLQICARKKEADLPVKIALISGFRDFDYARQALRYGVVDYLLKPINPSDVLRLVEEVVLRSLPASPLPETCERQERLIIEQIRRWIHDHLHEEITLLDLAHRFHYSVGYLSLLFKKESGKGFQEYLVACRMQRARSLLQDPALRIADIAQQVGYSNPKAFSMAFHKAFGLSPTDFREIRGKDTKN